MEDTTRVPSHIVDEALKLSTSQAFKAAIESLTRRYFDEWQQAGDPEVREVLWVQAAVLEDVRRELTMLHDHNKLDVERIRQTTKKIASQRGRK